MSFFLLGRLPDNALRLLSDTGFDSRSDAMAELQRLTADPAFELWDAEVFVADLNAATPVLLVRPATEATPAEPEASAEEEVIAEEPEAAGDELPESVEAESVEAESVEPEADEPETATDAEPAEEPQPAEDAEPAEDAFATPATAAEPSDVDLSLPEETVVAEAPEAAADEAVVEDAVDDAFADAVMADAGEDEAESSLRDALRRAADDLEADGIVAPESIGPATGEPVAWPWDTSAPADESAEEEPAHGEAAEEEPAAPAMETEAIGEDAPDSEAAPAAPAPYKFDPLDEPAIDVTPLVTGEGDDATVAASRPVILGAYDQAGLGEPAVEEAVESAAEDAAEPEAEGEATESDAVDDAVAAEEPEPEPESDFILDLEAIAGLATAEDSGEDSAEEGAVHDADAFGQDASVPQPDETPASAYVPTVGDIEHMSCNDCVYMQTCPNKGQRDPATCGSFQWRAS